MSAEKLTITPPVSVRFTESGLRELHMLADIRGMERSDYIRHLVSQDKLAQQKVWRALYPWFADGGIKSTTTANDNVRRSEAYAPEGFAPTRPAEL